MRFWGHVQTQSSNDYLYYKKKALRIICKKQNRQSCRDLFKLLGVLTLPCIYILETILFSRFKCLLSRGTDIHSYNTRYNEFFRPSQHRLNLFQNLPAEAGINLLNCLPEHLKIEENPKLFKLKLKNLLVTNSFYSAGEFMEYFKNSNDSKVGLYC